MSGLFTSKIGIALLAGSGITLGGLGLLFTGSETLQSATGFVNEAGVKIEKYEANEAQLVGKIAAVKEEANVKIADLKGQVETLSDERDALVTSVDSLEDRVSVLETEIRGLERAINEANGDNEQLTADLAAKVAELESTKRTLSDTQAKLTKANKEIKTLTDSLNWALKKAKEADKVVGQLEGEIIKANTEVEAHGAVVEQVKADTEADQPLTQEEIDAIGTTVGTPAE